MSNGSAADGATFTTKRFEIALNPFNQRRVFEIPSEFQLLESLATLLEVYTHGRKGDGEMGIIIIIIIM